MRHLGHRHLPQHLRGNSSRAIASFASCTLPARGNSRMWKSACFPTTPQRASSQLCPIVDAGIKLSSADIAHPNASIFLPIALSHDRILHLISGNFMPVGTINSSHVFFIPSYLLGLMPTLLKSLPLQHPSLFTSYRRHVLECIRHEFYCQKAV